MPIAVTTTGATEKGMSFISKFDVAVAPVATVTFCSSGAKPSIWTRTRCVPDGTPRST
jgi:hypothetical protein